MLHKEFIYNLRCAIKFYQFKKMKNAQKFYTRVNNIACMGGSLLVVKFDTTFEKICAKTTKEL